MSGLASPYVIKTFGAGLDDFRFSRLPTVVAKARQRLGDYEVTGILICALVRSGQMTGLLFCDRTQQYPEGLPIRAGVIIGRDYLHGYDLITTEGGGLWVIAHWLHENGEIGSFYSVQ